MEIFKSFQFEAAHQLPNLPSEHKCARLHGHSFRFDVHVGGPVDAVTGWVMDFAEIKRRVKPMLAKLDHHYLNDLEGLENPTSENIARWIWNGLKDEFDGLRKVTVFETCTSGCVYVGEESN